MTRILKEQVSRMPKTARPELARTAPQRPAIGPPERPDGVPPPGAATRPAESPEPSTAADRVTELQVSAHLMTLQTGLFCVFQTPGSAPPDPVTSLPGVRITPAPGISGRPAALSVTTFREDGWLNGTAALVRVTDGPAQILVSIYQNKGQDAAPRLQVLRLSGEPNADGEAKTVGEPVPTNPAAVLPGAPAAAPLAAAAPAGPNPEVMAHVQRAGDVTCDLGGWLGIKGSRQWVEGFGVAPNNGMALSDIEYQAVLGRNWLSPWVEGGKYCGSRGMALPLLGLKVRLKGEAAKTFDCSYSGTFVDGSASGPVSAGDPCEADSLAALEAFQIVIRRRGVRLGAAPDRKAVVKSSPPPAPLAKLAPRPRVRG